MHIVRICIFFLLFYIFPVKSQVITHQISDDSYAHVPLQFPFPLHGRTFTDSFMYSNGVVGFGSINNHWCCSGYDLANASGYQFNYSILGLQTDLINYGSGRFTSEGTTSYQRYRWQNISEYGAPNNLNTFSIEIRPTGYIGINHENINISTWRPVTVGITGDTERGEYAQFYHGQGYTSNIPVAYITQSTGDLCLIDQLSSPNCPNYQQAYLTQQCAISQLYSLSCPYYAEAYYNQQCSLNPLYDRNCVGYAEAYALANVVSPTVAITAPIVQVSTTGTVSVETPIIADPVVNEVVTRQSTNTVVTNAQTTTTVSNTIQTNATNEKKEESKSEKKAESKQVATVKKTEVSNEIQTQSIPTPNYEYKQPIILDLAYQKMVKKPIKDNNRAMYNLIMNSQRKHEEMIDEQYRR